MHTRFTLKAMTYAGLALAIAFVLSYARILSMPAGGSITLMSMFFVSLVGFWYGPVVGITAAATYGLLQMVQGAYVIHPVQFLLDYPLAFGMLGLSGFFRNFRGGVYIGFVVGAIGRFVMSTLAGWIFWIGVDTPGAMWGSIVYNGTYIFPEIGLTLVIMLMPPMYYALQVLKVSATDVNYRP